MYGGHLEPSSDILNHLGGHPGLSEALLEPYWAKKDPLTPRETPRPVPGEGVREKGKPLPEGEEGGVNALNHARPEGWWDYHAGLFFLSTWVK